MTVTELKKIYQDAYEKSPPGGNREGPKGIPDKHGAGLMAVWTEAIQYAGSQRQEGVRGGD